MIQFNLNFTAIKLLALAIILFFVQSIFAQGLDIGYMSSGGKLKPLQAIIDIRHYTINLDVNIANKKQRLIPNQQLNLNTKTNAIVINSVDVYDEIAWKQGVFSFKRKSLEDIMKVMSRWYDLDVKFASPELKKSGFNGIVGKDQKIEDILETIKSYGVIKEYEIKNKTVILK